MKLFQQLLVAPAALGLVAPMAAGAADLNMAGVSQYSSNEQVTSISQFSDVKPTDWAYQALSNLIERYGCVAGYPNGTYKGGQAMTRFEAAALLNACLDRVSEVTDELKKLMKEFEKELAILKGRVDGLETRVGVLESQQFSTTTKLKGIATFVIGGASYANNGFAATGSGNGVGAFGGTGNVSFNYDVRLNFDTSFTGKDLLRTTLRAGNFANSVFGNGNTGLEVAFQEGPAGLPGVDMVGINRLFYQFPMGESWTATFGAKVRQDDMLAMWPSAYPADTILDLFTYAGARGAYSLNLGAGVGLMYKKDGFSFSWNYVSNEADAESSQWGVGYGLTTTAQLGYSTANAGVALAYTYGNFSGIAASTAGLTPLFNGSGSTNSVGLSGYWSPSENKAIPSISLGFGWNDIEGNSSWSWMTGLQWQDAFMKGNALGMAIGSAGTLATTTAGNQPTGGIIFSNAPVNVGGTLAYELWYKFQVTDNISVTPAFFAIGNGRVPGVANSGNTTFGGLVKTTFKF
jgi:hypothetical protein